MIWIIITLNHFEELVKELEQTHFIPSLFFVDPYGYKGLSLRLIGALIKDWGCDCIFFFNYNRVNPALNNPAVKAHMNALFGEERAKMLGEKLKGLTPLDRELIVVEEMHKHLKRQVVSMFVHSVSRMTKVTEQVII